MNAGQSGYYRTLYAPAAFQALRTDFAKLAPIDQLGLMSDAWALGLAGDQPASDILDLIAALPADAEPQVWGRAAGAFEYSVRGIVDRSTNEPQHDIGVPNLPVTAANGQGQTRDRRVNVDRHDATVVQVGPRQRQHARRKIERREVRLVSAGRGFEFRVRHPTRVPGAREELHSANASVLTSTFPITNGADFSGPKLTS